jgi:hypothetical protein
MPMLWLGSCFAESMGPFLQKFHYQANINPLGIVYHPLVLLKLIGEPIETILKFNFEKDEIWLNYLLGNSFLGQSEKDLIDKIRIAKAYLDWQINHSKWLVMTWGTAIYYSLPDLGMVGKCHKQNQNIFQKGMSTPLEIFEKWADMIEILKSRNPDLKILLTVSPVRHTKDGMEANSVSKACLRLAIDQLTAKSAEVFYFPAFEIVVDELRDYRFFEKDLIHPNQEAISWIWNKFSNQYLPENEHQTNLKIEELNQLEGHRPLATFGPAFEKWRNNIENKKADLEKILNEESEFQ